MLYCIYMKIIRTTALLALMLAVFSGSNLSFLKPVQAQDFEIAAQKKQRVSKKSVIVKYKSAARPRELRLGAGESVDAVLKRLALDPTVEYAEPNYLLAASLTPNDQFVSAQWYLKRVKAFEAWDIESSSPGVVIAVIDSGVQISHPDLRGNIWINTAEIANNNKDDDHDGYIDDRYGWDFINNVPDPSPKFRAGFNEAGVLHGTIVAGIAAASGNNNEGISGVSWDGKIMALKALGDDGDGDTASVIKAIDYAVAKGANIINLSFVGFAYSRSLHDAIERAYNAGVLVVAPAGNEQAAGHGVDLSVQPIYPACYKNSQGQPIVIGVAATDGIDQKAPFSGYGGNCIALSAPGLSFFSTVVYRPDKSLEGELFDKYYDGYWSGTSVAVPLVSGALALIQGANPSLSPAQVRDILVRSTDDINALNPEYVGKLGSGRLNVARAVSQARGIAQWAKPWYALASATGNSQIFIRDMSGTETKSFMAYNPSFKGGVNLAAGDVDKDGNQEIITAPVSGLESDIRVFSADGRLKSHFLAYPASFRGGVSIATMDYNGDGRAEIITVPRAGYQSEVKIFSPQGKLLRSFLAYPPSFKGGATLVSGDVSGNSDPEIVTGPGPGGLPQVKIFSKDGKVLNSFLAGDRRNVSGLRLSLYDVDANIRRRQSEILVSRQGGTSTAMLYDFRGALRKSWDLYGTSYRGDAKTAVADLDGDGIKEVIAFPGPGASPHVRIFDRNGGFIDSFYAFDVNDDSGLNLTIFTTNR